MRTFVEPEVLSVEPEVSLYCNYLVSVTAVEPVSPRGQM